MAIQGLLGIYAPNSEIGQLFIAEAPRIFFFELVVMHSGVFWAQRHDIFKSLWAQNIASWALLVIFGLGILPVALESPWLGFNYITLCLARLFIQDPEPWYVKTDFFKKGIKPKSRNAFIGFVSFIKVLYLGALIPTIVMLFSSESQSYVEVVKKIHPEESDISSTIVFIKSVALYYLIYALYELYLKLPFKKQKP